MITSCGKNTWNRSIRGSISSTRHTAKAYGNLDATVPTPTSIDQGVAGIVPPIPGSQQLAQTPGPASGTRAVSGRKLVSKKRAAISRTGRTRRFWRRSHQLANAHTNSLYTSAWLEVGPPGAEYLTRRFAFGQTRDDALYDQLKQDDRRGRIGSFPGCGCRVRGDGAAIPMEHGDRGLQRGRTERTLFRVQPDRSHDQAARRAARAAR